MKTSAATISTAAIVTLVGCAIGTAFADAPRTNSTVLTTAHDGRSPGQLDVKRVVVRKIARGELRYDITMYGPWPNSALRGRSDIDIFVRRANDVTVYGGLEVGVIHGNLYAKYSDQSSRAVKGYGKVWRPSKRTIAVQFPRSYLAHHLRTYTWRIVTYYAKDGDGRCPAGSDEVSTCYDYVPDDPRRYIKTKVS